MVQGIRIHEANLMNIYKDSKNAFLTDRPPPPLDDMFLTWSIFKEDLWPAFCSKHISMRRVLLGQQVSLGTCLGQGGGGGDKKKTS
jgi:hypothetical protein